jgi:hypothetical protein
MANTYTLIASSTVGSGGAANFNFTSIPNTYTDLLLVMSARTTYADYSEQILVQFNNDGSTSNYVDRILYGFNTTVGSATRTGNSGPQDFNAVSASNTANTFSNNQLYIPNYASSNYKSYGFETVVENNGTNNTLIMDAGIWKNTSAITSIKASTIQSGSTFVQYSTAYLYGIKNS